MSSCKYRENGELRQKGYTLKYPREYTTYRQMIDRCTIQSNPNWHNYGGRGITVCSRWVDSFVTFIEDMGPRPSPKMTIDRIDNNKGYSPENCRWATVKQQNRNKRTNTVLTYKGESYCLIEWSEILGIHVNCILERLGKGWSVDKTLSTDPKDYNRNRPAKHNFTHNGVTKPLVQWAREQGILIQTVLVRIKLGWSIEDALFTPVKKRRNNANLD